MSRVIVYGAINADVVQIVDRLPRPGETVVAGEAQWSGGGKAANQAHAARGALGDAHTVQLVGSVGDDPQGDALLGELRDAGVDVTACAVVPGPSGLAVVTVDGRGENTVVVSPGANARWPAGLAASVVPSRGDVVVVQLEIPLAEAARVLASARGHGARTLLNAAPAHPDARALLDDVDILVVNSLELHDLFGVAAPAEVTDFDGELVVTLGADGSTIRAGGREQHVPAFRVEAVATVGSGDAFVGALAAALAEGADLVDAARRGSAAGALTATVAQARHPALSPGALTAMLREEMGAAEEASTPRAPREAASPREAPTHPA